MLIHSFDWMNRLRADSNLKGRETVYLEEEMRLIVSGAMNEKECPRGFGIVDKLAIQNCILFNVDPAPMSERLFIMPADF